MPPGEEGSPVYPKRRSRTNPEPRTEPAVDFIGPQQGAVETRLTESLTELFRTTHREVTRAYLARVCYRSTGSVVVALCIRSTAKNNGAVVANVGQRFAGLFSLACHMDIIFINAAQDEDLASVCAPFYQAAQLAAEKGW